MTAMHFLRRTPLLLLLAIGLAAGCNQPGPEVVPVSGTLMRKGKPVAGLQVVFKPSDGRPSFGESDDNGRFTLRYTRDQDGAKVGTHTVWVTWQPRSAAEEFAGVRPSAEVMQILRHYGTEERTTLKEIVIKEATDDLVITLD